MHPKRPVHIGDQARLARADFNALIGALQRQGYAVIGPAVCGGAVVYTQIDDDSDLPIGWSDEQDAGTYRLRRQEDPALFGPALFGYVSGAQSWKRFLFPPEVALWTATGDAHGFEIEVPPQEIPRYAFLGMRACELKAVSIQDTVLKDGTFQDPNYAARREKALFIAVNCGRAAATCFCVSMQAGPRAEEGYDLALTEIITADRHDFLVEIGSERGAEIAALLPLQAATSDDRIAADDIVAETSRSMGRTLQTQGLKALLQDNPEHPHWDEVASRCLSCANCTLVCPTCFCRTPVDITDLGGHVAARHQRWDSCFSLDFSYIRGGSVRPGVAARYRQWMTHKLANWIDQFGESGCVGCGRCVTWCPAGIDITSEAAAIRADVEGD